MVTAKQIQGLTCSFITTILCSEVARAGICLALTHLEASSRHGGRVRCYDGGAICLP